MNLHFTSPNTTAGTFVASGAIADAGLADVRDLSLTPIGRTDTARLSGTETYSGDRGTIVTRFEGIAFPLSSPHEVGIGRFEIVLGTGAYAGVSGTVGSFCTITSSNVAAIEPGMNVVYLAPASPDVLDSDLVLSSGNGGAAVGR